MNVDFVTGFRYVCIFNHYLFERGLLPLCGGLGGALGGPGDGGLADDPDVALRDVAEQALVPRPVVPAHAHQLSHTVASLSLPG